MARQLTMAEHTADAVMRRIEGDLAAVVRDAMPGIDATEAQQRAEAMAMEYPHAALLFMLEAHRIRLATRAMQP